MKSFLGGPNLGVFDGCLITEELSWGCTGMSTALVSTALGVSKRFLHFYGKQFIYVFSETFPANIKCFVNANWYLVNF